MTQKLQYLGYINNDKCSELLHMSIYSKIYIQDEGVSEILYNHNVMQPFRLYQKYFLKV